MKLFLRLFFCLLALKSMAQVEFVDVAQENGVTWSGKTFGASWADVTGNGFPDLFMQCHSNFFDAYFNDDLPRYYFNTGSVFSEGTILDEISETDWHGGMMFDVDNDGDLDHLSLTGGSSANIFFENNDGSFSYENTAVSYGLDCDGCVGRSPGLIDANNDGFLDVLLSNLDENDESTGPRLFLNQANQSFSDSSEDYGLEWEEATFSVSADLIGDGSLNVLYLRGRPVITTLEDGTFQDALELPISNNFDFQIEDLNGDLQLDIFAVTGRKSAAVDEVTDNLIRGHIPFSSSSAEIEIQIESEETTPELSIYPRNVSTPFIVITGENNVSAFTGVEAQFDLNESSSSFVGIPAIEDTLTRPHIYIGFDEDTNFWRIRFKSGLSNDTPFGIEFLGESSEVLSFNGIDPPPNLKDRLFLNEGNLEFNSVLGNLFDETDNSVSVTTADFDNDMDMDIYVLRTSYAENKPNLLYENVDNQSFIKHVGAWGAAGDGPGIGEAVNSVDYDNDGFMDLFVTNGVSVFFLDSARVNLYRNQGNNNNWLKIILNGIISNPLGLHAKVYAYSGGVAQMRYQDGGFHRYSQDDNRIHFGLGQNEAVDSIVVDWPSGIHQVISDVSVNQTLVIDEDFELSTNANSSSELLKVFPNPAKNLVSVQVPGRIIKEIKIFNNQGRLLKDVKYNNNKSRQKILFADFAGVATLQVELESGLIMRKKVVFLGI